MTTAHHTIRLLLLGLTSLTLVACDGGDDFFDAGVDLPVEGLCYEACTALEECGSCDSDPDGNCYGQVQCIEVCEEQGSHDRFACLTGTSGCSGPLSQCGGFCAAADVEGCLDGSAVTDCHAACGILEACEACVNDTNGNCLSTPSCVTACESEESEGFACVANLNSCDGGAIATCFEGDRPAPEDACALGCLALDDCELCLAPDDQPCLDAEQCVATCRGASDELDAARAQCIADLAACDPDGVADCLSGEPSPGDDDCGLGCARLDTCDLCLPDENEECQTPVACAEACREGADAAGLACIAELDACDEEAIATCLDAEPDPGDDACGRGCSQLDACGFCLPDAADECQTPLACAEACRAGESAQGLACISELMGCDEPAIDACLNEEPVQAPSCELFCARRADCTEVAEMERMVFTAMCVAECTAEDDAEQRTCYVDAEACEAASECLSASPEPEPEPEPAADAGVEPAADAGIEPAADAGVEPAADAGEPEGALDAGIEDADAGMGQ
ncbi:MAG: hypothetical protein ACI9U2_002867 [Bradymonadia bacterium]|jgi:hypothetical protein